MGKRGVCWDEAIGRQNPSIIQSLYFIDHNDIRLSNFHYIIILIYVLWCSKIINKFSRYWSQERIDSWEKSSSRRAAVDFLLEEDLYKLNCHFSTIYTNWWLTGRNIVNVHVINWKETINIILEAAGQNRNGPIAIYGIIRVQIEMEMLSALNSADVISTCHCYIITYYN